MEDFKEDRIEVSFEEEDEFVDLCNVTIAECWGTTREIVQTCSRNVPTVLL